MKPQFLLLLASLIFISLTASECKKHKSGNPIDQLPAETQTGANTFGCLINGQVFLPKGPSLNPILTCYYQYIYSPSSSGYVFQVAARDNSHPSILNSVNILCDSVKLEESKTYTLQEVVRGLSRGNYRHFTDTSLDDFFTYSPFSGELFLKRFDETNQIASGTFWFNAVDTNGDTVHVTDGRFDMQFTK
ncbi:MAG: DUF6252 family protein [Ginsengibacter sp.]